MQQRKRLRAVTSDENPPIKSAPAKTLKAAAEKSERELLVKMRDDISDAVSAGVPPHTLAPLMRQLREIDKEIRMLDQHARQESAHDGHVDDTFDASAI